MLIRCLEIGNLNDSVNRILQVEQVAAIHRKSLASTKEAVVWPGMRFLAGFWSHCRHQHNSNTMQWPRVIQSAIAAMKRHSNHTDVQREGSKLLKVLSLDGHMVQHILAHGGLPLSCMRLKRLPTTHGRLTNVFSLSFLLTCG